MSDIRSDSYNEMKALLNERLDSIIEVEDAQEGESRLKKWGKRAATVALGAGLAVGGAQGAKYGLRALSRRNPTSMGLRRASRWADRVANPIRSGRSAVRGVRRNFRRSVMTPKTK